MELNQALNKQQTTIVNTIELKCEIQWNCANSNLNKETWDSD